MPVLTFLMTNLKSAAAVAVALIAAYILHATAMAWESHRMETALSEQKAALTASCEKDKAISTEISNEYQNRLADLDSRLAAAKLRQPECVQLAEPAAGHDAPAAGHGDAGRNAVDPGALLEFGAKAEKYQSQLRACQEFIARERK